MAKVNIKKISTKNMSKADWLAERKKGIGGSDMACVLGLNNYKSAFALYNEKISEVVQDDIQSEAMRIGTDLEEYCSKRFTEKSGIKVKKENNILINAEFPFIRANIDRLCVGEEAGLECKTASAWNTKEYEKYAFPARYYAQCVTYMAVTGKPTWYLAVLIMGRDFKVYQLTTIEDKPTPPWCESTVYVSDDEIDSLIEQARAFWDCVESKNPPKLSGMPCDSVILDDRYKTLSYEERDVTAYSTKFDRLFEIKRMMNELGEEKRLIENEIKMYLEDCSRGASERYRVSYAYQYRSNMNKHKLCADYPNINLDDYKLISASRVLRISEIEGR